VEIYLHSPNTPSWRGAQLKQRDNFNFTFTFTCLIPTLITFEAYIHMYTHRVTQSEKGDDKRFSSSSPLPDWLWVLTMGTRDSFLGTERPKHEADHPHSPSADMSNSPISTFTPSTHFRGAVLRHRDNFTFYNVKHLQHESKAFPCTWQHAQSFDKEF
jgi:hypothetical protein